jgi:signal transduction histidine kinase
MSFEPFGYSEEVLTAIPYGCLVLDQEGKVQALNPAALVLLRKKPEDLLKKQLFEAVPEWAGLAFKGPVEQLLNGKENQSPVSYKLPGAGGTWLEARVLSLFSDSPAAGSKRFLLVLADMTELVKLKDQMRRSEHQASIGKLARGIAHELNNPLDGVLRYTHLALEQMPEETAVREYVVHIKEGLDRMVRAAKAFLEFARQASTPIQRTADLNRVVEDALLLVRHRAKFQQIQILTDYDRSLPPVMDGGLAYAVVNLVRNAFDAMPSGGTLKISTRQTASGICVRVEDTGVGIPEKARANLYEPFFSTKPSHKGSGLGLAIAKEAVERSGGRLEFESRIGEGTVFQILVPAIAGLPVMSERK